MRILVSFHMIYFQANWPTYEVSHSKVEEIFCDRFARALLLPKILIDFSKFDFYNLDIYQVSDIKRLWPEFKVPPLANYLKNYLMMLIVTRLFEFCGNISQMKIVLKF